jgi:integrase
MNWEFSGSNHRSNFYPVCWRDAGGAFSANADFAPSTQTADRRYLASRADRLPWLFVSEGGQPLTRQSVNYLVASAAARAALPSIWPHMLRHSCGFYLPTVGTICGLFRTVDQR